MDTLYLISMLVGGFFVLLSIFGGDHESDADVDVDADVDMDVDFDADMDADMDTDFDADFAHDFDHDMGHDLGSGVGFVDLLSLRALFLFAAFFGLTGTLLTWLSAGEPLVALLSVFTGLLIGLGGNFVIKRFAYEAVSSEVLRDDLRGLTAKVILPFEGEEKGKITVVAKGQRIQLLAQAFDDETPPFENGDEVVVIRMKGRVAEVVRPN